MSNNPRKHIDTYTKVNSNLAHKVLRPKSMRMVNPYNELNKLYTKVKLVKYLRDEFKRRKEIKANWVDIEELLEHLDRILESYIDMR